MMKKRWNIWHSQLAYWIKTMRFSALDSDTQTCLKREMFYFNTSRFVGIAVVSMVLEAVNIVNVLFFSRSGLATANNRLYFTMYLIMFASALLCLVIRHNLQDRPTLLQGCYVVFTLVWVLWHAVLTSIDLRHNSDIMVYTTGILALSLLVQMKPVQLLSILTAGLVLLLVCARNNLSNGNVVNAFIVTVVAMMIFCSHHFSMVDELGLRQKMILQENHRQKEKQKLALLYEQQAALLSHSREFLFLWDKEADRLIFAESRGLCSSDKETLLAWCAQENKRKENVVTLRLEHGGAPCEYLIESTHQYDCDGMVIGIAGRIIAKKYPYLQQPFIRGL